MWLSYQAGVTGADLEEYSGPRSKTCVRLLDCHADGLGPILPLKVPYGVRQLRLNVYFLTRWIDRSKCTSRWRHTCRSICLKKIVLCCFSHKRIFIVRWRQTGIIMNQTKKCIFKPCFPSRIRNIPCHVWARCLWGGYMSFNHIYANPDFSLF